MLDKVKSLLAYKETKGAVSDKYKWGFEVKDDTENPLQWFKLLLHKGGQETTFGFDKTSTSGTRRLPRLEATVTKKPKTKCPVDLVTDYLSALHKYFLHYLQKEYPSSLVGSLGKETPVYYYLTVPTVSSLPLLLYLFRITPST